MSSKTEIEIGGEIIVDGYTTLARAECDHGSVLVLSNDSSHLLVVEIDAEGDTTPLGSTVGYLRASYGYSCPGDESAMGWTAAYKMALGLMVETVLMHSSEPHPNPEACPGCGCMPGDGVTKGCTHPDGCGYHRECGAAEGLHPEMPIVPCAFCRQNGCDKCKGKGYTFRK